MQTHSKLDTQLWLLLCFIVSKIQSNMFHFHVISTWAQLRHMQMFPSWDYARFYSLTIVNRRTFFTEFWNEFSLLLMCKKALRLVICCLVWMHGITKSSIVLLHMIFYGRLDSVAKKILQCWLCGDLVLAIHACIFAD